MANEKPAEKPVKKQTLTIPPDSFPITLDEFVAGLPVRNIETAKAFRSQFPRTVARKTSQEWNLLLKHFGSKPTDTPWSEWIKKLKIQEEVTVNE